MNLLQDDIHESGFFTPLFPTLNNLSLQNSSAFLQSFEIESRPIHFDMIPGPKALSLTIINLVLSILFVFKNLSNYCIIYLSFNQQFLRSF